MNHIAVIAATTDGFSPDNLEAIDRDFVTIASAQAQFEAAVAIARTLGDPIAEGQFLGYLGLLHARQGRHDDARRCLESGQSLLHAASDAFGLGVLLTSRAEAHHLAGDGAAATASLAAAATIAAEVGAGYSRNDLLMETGWTGTLGAAIAKWAGVGFESRI